MITSDSYDISSCVECSLECVASKEDGTASAEDTTTLIISEGDNNNSNDSKWSFKGIGNALVITLSGTLSSVGRYETRLEAAINSGGSILSPSQTYDSIFRWTREADKALVEYLNIKKLKAEITLGHIHTFAIAEKFLAYEGNILSSKSMIDIQLRVLAIEAFNKSLEYFLPFIDLTNEDPLSMVGHQLFLYCSFVAHYSPNYDRVR